MSSGLQKGSWGCCPIGIREPALDLESGRQERSGVPFQINALGLILLFTHVYKVSGSLLRASTMPTIRRSQHRAEKSCSVFSMSLLRRCTGKASAYQGGRYKRPTRVQTLGGKIPWRRKWQPTPVFLPGKSRDRETWWATVCEVPKSLTGRSRHSQHEFNSPGEVVNNADCCYEALERF